ncbi:MAG: hypothetical protein FWG85_08015 [Bacteroidetes bacterium]|nr:hypothetical protein [Bacteroidota bacterium]
MKKYLTLFAIILAMQNANAGVFDGTQGDGTEGDPYLIYNITDLKEVADSMPNLYSYNRDLHFKLMADITTPVDFRIEGFGPSNSIYNRTFDGNKYKITLNLNMPQNAGVALFKTVESNAVVKNLSVDGEVIGNIYVAGIVGRSYGTIENCINYANITGLGNGRVGGIAGEKWGQIIACNNYGTIINSIVNATTFSLYTGGIVGLSNNGVISKCINAGNVICNNVINDSNVGGIVGQMSGATNHILEYCLNIGCVTGSSFVGGICGMYFYSNNSSIITNCINAGFVKGNKTVSGITVLNAIANGVAISNCINTGVIIADTETEVGAILGRIPYNNNGATITNCHYDKQFCIYKGVNGQDVPGVSGHITRNMVGRKLASLLGDTDWTYVEGATLIESLYPQLKAFSESPDERKSDESKVGATPIFLYDGIKD